MLHKYDQRKLISSCSGITLKYHRQERKAGAMVVGIDNVYHGNESNIDVIPRQHC